MEHERAAGGRTTDRGLGLAVTFPEPVVLTAAGSARRQGYSSFWLNNLPGTDALEVLARVAQSTPAMRLGVGVIPLSHVDPSQVVGLVRSHAVPVDRLYLGIGSGSGPGGVERVERGIEQIRSMLDCRITVAALGPRMCRLAGGAADAVLLNWLTPDFARQALDWIEEGAAAAGRPVPRVMAYVRVSLGDEGRQRLEVEAARYEGAPQYAAHFTRMGARAIDTVVAGATDADVGAGLARWQGVVDEVVVRAIPGEETEEGLESVIAAAAP